MYFRPLLLIIALCSFSSLSKATITKSIELSKFDYSISLPSGTDKDFEQVQKLCIERLLIEKVIPTISQSIPDEQRITKVDIEFSPLDTGIRTHLIFQLEEQAFYVDLNPITSDAIDFVSRAQKREPSFVNCSLRALEQLNHEQKEIYIVVREQDGTIRLTLGE